MTETTLTDIFKTLFEAKAEQKSIGLNQFQSEAFSAFQELGLPDRKSEAYKFTQVDRILGKAFDSITWAPVKSSWTLELCQNEFYHEEDANHLVFLNGQFKVSYSKITSNSIDLEIALIDESNIGVLGKVSNQSKDPFAQLNAASFGDGLYLKSISKTVNKPVFIYHFYDNESSQGVAMPRILIEAETRSFLDVYEKTFTTGENAFLINSILEAKVETNAEVRFTKVQNYDKSIHAIEGIYASVERDSRFYTNTYSFNGGLIRNNVVIDIDGENCEGHMNGLYLLGGKSHVDNNTTVDHKQPNSYSNELYKGVLAENSRGVFNGKIYVRPDAQKTNAFQTNNNILLSDTAIINTKPQLEIWADDVKCSHGCTTGQLDEEAIFYLRSRGISKQRAKALMLYAYSTATLAEVKSEEVKTEIENIILNKLG
jgi:Fe-S cluster assembly protein SufD